MELVNVFVAPAMMQERLSEDKLRQIAAVSSRIKLMEASALVTAERKGDFTSKEKLDTLLAKAEVVYGTKLPPNLIARAPKLKWIQLMSAGVDHHLSGKLSYPGFHNEFLQSSIILTNASAKLNATSLAECGVAMMLMFAKQALVSFRQKQQKRWAPFRSAALYSKTVAVVGLGTIGQQVARICKGIGMRVTATRRSTRRAGRARYVDVMLPREQLPQLLSESDFVVLTLPLTPETRGLIGEKELRTMKPTAYLIEICRGEIIDEEALIRALDEHWIAGAGMEAFATEPLPPDSRLWELPNLIIYPHCGGGGDDYEMGINKMFCENLGRYLSGKKLRHVVGKKKGY